MEENRRTRACRGLGAVVGDALARQLVGRRQVVLVDDDADDSAGDAVGDEKEVLLESRPSPERGREGRPSQAQVSDGPQPMYV